MPQYVNAMNAFDARQCDKRDAASSGGFSGTLAAEAAKVQIAPVAGRASALPAIAMRVACWLARARVALIPIKVVALERLVPPHPLGRRPRARKKAIGVDVTQHGIALRTPVGGFVCWVVTRNTPRFTSQFR